ncbi:unnamed protein product [Adineta steineri]|uniref:F-box domain-containing protein n=1 Tax=Adineta steineri TaxID=433720 RepID=A0A814YA32_9BILA|nr:unnamed protein product [Adineta steineri]CAF1519551.1 unnamed protein product [Adineta steineri]
MTSSRLTIDNLPVELLYKIFNNLSTFDIYFHVSLVNHHLYTVARSYSNFELFENTPEFKQLCARLLPSQVSSLGLHINRTVADYEDCDCQFHQDYNDPEHGPDWVKCCVSWYDIPVDEFGHNQACKFYKFNKYSAAYHSDRFFTFCHDRLDQFNRIRSLDLYGIPEESFSQVIDRLISLIPQLALTLYRIIDLNFPFDERIEHYTRFIRTLQNLREISFCTPCVLLKLMPIVFTIQHVNLIRCTINQWRDIKAYLPNLCSIKIGYLDIADNHSSEGSIITAISINHDQTTSKIIGFDPSLMKTTVFVDLHINLSTLSYLSLQHQANTNQDFDEYFDGSWWESTLKISAPMLKSFEFEFYFHNPPYLSLKRMDKIMKPFQTAYWMTQKRWYVHFMSSDEYGSYLFTKKFAFDQYDDCESSSTCNRWSIWKSVTRGLVIDYSTGHSLPNLLESNDPTIDLYIRGPMLQTIESSGYLTLEDHIKPYVNYNYVERLRLGANIKREGRRKSKHNLRALFRQVTYLKIDRLEYLDSLYAQRIKFLRRLAKKIDLIILVEKTNWCFSSDKMAIDKFCQFFLNLKQLDLTVNDLQAMTFIIDALLHLEKAIFRFPIYIREILLINEDLCLFTTRLNTMNWSYEIFQNTIHLYIGPKEICSESKLKAIHYLIVS